MGGEKLTTFDAGKLIPGSPPRGRGKEYVSQPSRTWFRITPAWAGKSPESAPASIPAQDHPRVGGEKTAMLKLHTLVPGSPPRGRGKVQKLSIFQIAIRITPAWAGKSFCSGFKELHKQDHPRVGGEKSAFDSSGKFIGGSPPRGRGKVKELSLIGVTDRITPAWAGKRHSMHKRKTCAEDHPRVGGEKYRSSRTSMCVKGSPPRGRGKAAASKRPSRYPRITPAWAGKSDCPGYGRFALRDHPRVGGEKIVPPCQSVCIWGSPPRGRGKGTG